MRAFAFHGRWDAFGGRWKNRQPGADDRDRLSDHRRFVLRDAGVGWWQANEPTSTIGHFNRADAIELL